MEKIKVGIIGLGFIGMQHLDALMRVPGVEVAGICSRNETFVQKTAQEYHIPKYTMNWQELVLDPEIQVIHNCTPHSLHDVINETAIRNRKHIYSEKPLSLTLEKAREMWQLAKQYDVAHGVNHQYRMNAAVQEMRCRFQQGEAGKPLLVYGHYLQESASRPTDFTRKMANTGIARCINDIGIHFIDTVSCIMDSPVTAVMADCVTHYPVRTDENGNQHEMHTEDSACILLRFANGVSGSLITSKAANGHKNDLEVNLLCEQYGMAWHLENPDHLFIGEKGVGTTETYMNPKLVHEEVKPYVNLPMGHTMGWTDALKNALCAFYASIRDGSYHNEKQPYCTFRDGVLGNAFIEACIQSSQIKQWVEVEQP